MQQSITVNSGVFNQFKINTGFNDLVENIKNWVYSVLGLSEMYPDTEDESEEDYEPDYEEIERWNNSALKLGLSERHMRRYPEEDSEEDYENESEEGYEPDYEETERWNNSALKLGLSERHMMRSAEEDSEEDLDNVLIPGVSESLGLDYFESYNKNEKCLFTVKFNGFNGAAYKETKLFDKCVEALACYDKLGYSYLMCDYDIFLNKEDGSLRKLELKEVEDLVKFENNQYLYEMFQMYVEKM